MKVYKRAISQPDPVGAHFKPIYLEWAVVSLGIQHARRLFNRISQKKPYCFELHKKMIGYDLSLLKTIRDLDSPSAKKKIKNCRNCLELTKKIFGHCEPEIWIELIKFEVKYGDSKEMNILYELAQATLEAKHLTLFLQLYNLMKN